MWELYDSLIDPIPEDLVVEDCVTGLHWTLVKSKSTGIVMTFKEGSHSSKLHGKIKGMKLKELAQYVKSWNFFEAAVGLSAINSFYNNIESVKRIDCNVEIDNDRDAFEEYKEEIKGKKVVVIGHFPKIERLGEICDLSILERNPLAGDYPDSACEYIMEQQDYIFSTGTTITNKTLPRLLQLSKKAKIIMVGPSVPLAPVLFDYGIDVLAGTVSVDDELLWREVKEGACTKIFKNGAHRVNITK